MFPTVEFVLGLILSGIVGVAITIWYQHWSAFRLARWDLFRQLSRFGPNHNEFLLAINELPAVFYSRKHVMGAHREYLAQKTTTNSVFNDALVDLIKAVAQDVGARGLSHEQLTHRFREIKKAGQ